MATAAAISGAGWGYDQHRRVNVAADEQRPLGAAPQPGGQHQAAPGIDGQGGAAGAIASNDQVDPLAAPEDLGRHTGSEPDGRLGVGGEPEAAAGFVGADRPGPSGGGGFSAEVGELTEGGGGSGIRHVPRFGTDVGEQRLRYERTGLLVK